MNIIFLDAVQDFGGSQKSTINLINNIIPNHKVMFVDFWGTDELLFENLENNKIPYSILDKRLSPIVIKEKGNKLKTFKNFINYFFNKKKLQKKFHEVENSFKPDVVIVNNLKSLSILSNKGTYKIIFFERTWFANQNISFIKKIYFKKVNSFFAVSNATRAAIYAKGITTLDKIFLLPNSIYLNESHLQREGKIDRVNILNCGGYINTKGLHHTIEMGIKLKKMNIDFHIDIVGVLYKGEVSQNYYEYLKLKISENKLQHNIKLHVNIKDVKPFFQNAHILVHPTYTEGLPRVIMEAMVHSVPVIANPVGGVNDYILDGYTGFLTNYNDIDDFVDKIIALKEDQNLYNSISNNAYMLIKDNYNNCIQMDKFNNIIKNI